MAHKRANGTNGTPKKGHRIARKSDLEATRARALAAFAKVGTVSAACEAAKIGRTTWYRWLESDEAFRERVAAATDGVLDDLEATAIRRAKEGSDTLIIFLLKARRRHLYGDRQTITVVHPDVKGRLERQVRIISERAQWTREELFAALDPVWDDGRTDH